MRRMNVVRNRKQALKIVKEFDAFPKVPESYKETTASGGGVSIVVFIFIAILVISEVRYYSETDLKFDYDVDQNHTGKLQINLDMTVAMKCDMIGADVLDLTGQNANTFGRLKQEAAHFELTESQLNYLYMIQNINDYIKNEYHAIHHFLWKTGYTGMDTSMPPRDDKTDKPPDGCRVHGSLILNKVAGNFHVTAGKSVPLGKPWHVHIASIHWRNHYNFSHRIDHFSFGEPTPGVVNPLDGDYKVIHNHMHMFQYFIQVVPTKVTTLLANVDTFQYAVTEQNRSVNHAQGSHGIPGIFVKYDLSPLKVIVKEEYKPYWQFLVRLCGIIGGIFATSGMLHSIIGFILDVAMCRYKIGGGGQQKTPDPNMPTKNSIVNPAEPHTPVGYSTANLMTASQDPLLSSLPAVNLLPQGGGDGFTEIDPNSN